MNKKLIILIVALECVFSVFLVSLFGPMIEALHAKVLVSEIHLIDEQGERLVPEEGKDLPSVAISLPGDLDYHFTLEVLEADATDKSVTVTTNRPLEEIEVRMDKNGHGFTVTFLNPTLKSVTVTVASNDGSAKTASVYIEKEGGNHDIGDIFGQ